MFWWCMWLQLDIYSIMQLEFTKRLCGSEFSFRFLCSMKLMFENILSLDYGQLGRIMWKLEISPQNILDLLTLWLLIVSDLNILWYCWKSTDRWFEINDSQQNEQGHTHRYGYIFDSDFKKRLKTYIERLCTRTSCHVHYEVFKFSKIQVKNAIACAKSEYSNCK